MSRDDLIAMAKEAGIHIDVLPDDYCSTVGLPAGSVSRWDGVGIEEVEALIVLAAAKEREAIAARIAALVAADSDKWRQAIDHELIVAHLGVANPEDDPAALLQALIQWHVDVALNPAVSERARALVDGEREACAQVADLHARGWKMNPGANPEAGFIASSNCATAIRARGKP